MNLIKKLQILALASAAIFMAACNEDDAPISAAVVPTELNRDLGGFTLDSISVDQHKVYVSPSAKGGDSLKFKGLDFALDIPEGSKIYLATTTDADDPGVVNWDVLIKDGVSVSMKDTASVAIVVLDEKSRPVAVWEIVNTEAKTKEPSEKVESSSSAKDEAGKPSEGDEGSGNATSSADAEGEGDEKPVESSDSEPAEQPESSADGEPAEESSSSDEAGSDVESSDSSEDIESSESGEETPVEPEEITLATLRAIYNGEEIAPVVTDHKVYFELPYGADLTQIRLNSEEGSKDLTRAVAMNFKNESGVEEEYSVVAGVQLPGSDFSARNSFWGTTSDAMAVDGSGSYITSIIMKSSANAEFASSELTLTSKLVVGVGLGIPGGWKLAGGFYYAGSFSGSNAGDIYMADPSSGNACVDNCPADLTKFMTFGRPFNGRPSGFDVKYSYEHVDNNSKTQKSLIYVVLVSADKKIVAAGTITDDESMDLATRSVELKYGNDAGLLSAGYAGVSDLKLGTGEEAVASIRVMFASSAEAFIVDGGSKAFAKSNYRGGENAKLILDNFKLNY